MLYCCMLEVAAAAAPTGGELIDFSSDPRRHPSMRIRGFFSLAHLGMMCEYTARAGAAHRKSIPLPQRARGRDRLARVRACHFPHHS